MELIPVLDLQGGVVVGARGGERHNYRPLQSPLSPSSDPVEVMRGLLRLHPFATFYAADLDAIAGRGDNRAALRRLRAERTAALWVDSGINGSAAAQCWFAQGLGDLVVGSESLGDTTLLEALGGEPRVLLSLDFRDDQLQGPAGLMDVVEAWPQRVIVMSLSRVGSGSGPDLGLLGRIRNLAGERRKVYAAGGIRDAADVAALRRAGIAGVLLASALHQGRLGSAEIAALQRAPT